MKDTLPSSKPTSPMAPFRHKAFAMLWIATVASNIGTWMHDVGAGWLMTELAPSPMMVAAVQAATTLPIFLFALLAGAVADIVDRRKLLIWVNLAMGVAALAMAAVVYLELVTPMLLLFFTFLFGTGAAFIAPAWQAIVPKLVPREDLSSAIALNSMGINVSRAIGPALAGFLIVAAGLGVTGSTGVEPAVLLLCGALLTLPVWAAGVMWGRFATRGYKAQIDAEPAIDNGRLLRAFAPFLVMAGLLILGGVVGPTGIGAVDFLLLPKGALITAAVLALLQTESGARRACLDSSVRRTGSLLLVIGTASAFGAVLTGMVSLDHLVPQGDGVLTLIALFALTVLFKLAQGSSMATFAAIAPVAAPIVLASGVNEIAAVFAICLGSFIAILPNDSYYWLVRRDALASEQSEGRAIGILTGGAVVQALVGIAILLAVVALWP